jgi:hypothetical protein
MKNILFRFIGVLCLFGCVSCGMIKGSSNPVIDKAIDTFNTTYPEDNFIEEGVEDAIDSWTGIDIDFSPASPEKK